MNDKPQPPATPEIPAPGRVPEVKPGQELAQPVWPNPAPEILPGQEPQPPERPYEIPGLPE